MTYARSLLISPGSAGTFHCASRCVRRAFGANAERWAPQVLAVRSGYGRAIGAAERLAEQAQALGQRWMRGIGVARRLAVG